MRRLIDQYIQQYGRRLYGLCRSLCASPYDADDLYQETWLRVVKHISQYDPSREFEPWLTRICVNTYRSTLRRLAKSPLLDFSNGDEKDRLPEKLRLAVVLFYFQGEDLASAAQILNIPIGTAKSRLNKARKLLKEVLAGETDL